MAREPLRDTHRSAFMELMAATKAYQGTTAGAGSKRIIREAQKALNDQSYAAFTADLLINWRKPEDAPAWVRDATQDLPRPDAMLLLLDRIKAATEDVGPDAGRLLMAVVAVSDAISQRSVSHPMEMDNRFNHEQGEVTRRFVESCQDYVGVHVTATGLKKSVLDATTGVREFLARNAIHDYATQRQGMDHKVRSSVTIADESGAWHARAISFNRPSSGDGDPRFWISRLGEICLPDSLLIFAIRDGRFVAKVFRHGDETGLPVTDEAQPLEPEALWRNNVGNLWDRATGGTDVAASPEQDPGFWEVSPRPAGVEAAVAWFRERLNSDKPTMLFLVGGPGAGKSDTAAELVAELTCTSVHDDGLASRSYDYVAANERKVRLVNDATIPNAESTPGALIEDIDVACGVGGALIACVNRGVLVEEMLHLRELETAGSNLSRALIQWLAGSAKDVAGSPIEVTRTESEFLRSASFQSGAGATAEAVAVSVDTCSLFEKLPHATFTGSADVTAAFQSEHYAITDFRKRKDLPAESVPALDLIGKVIGRLSTPEGPPQLIDPIWANVDSLSSSAVQQGLATVLRGAEIASNQRMTYRELWGAVARSIVGNLPEQIPRHEIEALVRARQPDATDPIERFEQVMDLAALRFSEALFHNERPGGQTYDPVLQLTAPVDPVLDARPGEFNRHDWSSGWAMPITDAFDTPLVDSTPLDGLRATLRDDDPFLAAITSFDSVVDEAYAEAMQVSRKDDQRFAFAVRYGAYLARLYAVANGIVAFRPEISLWTYTRLMSPTVPDELSGPLRTLLRPKRQPEATSSVSVIPVFDSRTDPIVGRSPQPRFGLRTGGVHMKTRAESDELVLTLIEEGTEVSSVTLDFILVREALASDADRPGITELTETASPRLERFRSASLLAAHLRNADFCALVGDKDIQVSVSGS